MRKVLSLLAVASLALGAAGCGDDDDDEASASGSEAAAEDAAEGEGGAEDTGGDTTEVSIEGFAFDPAEIEISGGDNTFHVTNADDAPHTFTVDDAELRIEVPAGGEATGTGNFGPGDYDLRCEIHPAMTGTVSVIGGGQ